MNTDGGSGSDTAGETEDGDMPSGMSTVETHLKEGRARREAGEYRRAALAFGQAAQLARNAGDTFQEIEALNLQAGAVNAMGQPQRALQILQRALAAGEDPRYARRLASVHNNIGDLERVLGNFPEALEHLMAARNQFQEETEPGRASAINLINLANLYQDMGRVEEARRFLIDAQAESEAMGDLSVAAVALNSLANSDLRLGHYRVAGERFTAALEKSRRLGDSSYQTDNLDGLGQALAALGDYEGALETHRQALDIARSANDYEGELDALVNLGRDRLQLGQATEAVSCLEAALSTAVELEYTRRIIEIHELLSEANEAAGDPWAALRHARRHQQLQSRMLSEESETKLRELQVKFQLAQSEHEAEKYRLRTGLMKEAIADARERVRVRTQELEDAYLDIAERLARAAEYRDDGTGEHTQRVGRNAAVIAALLGFREEDMEVLFVAAKLHDVGKIGVPDSILYKVEQLTSEERALMEQHTIIGAGILADGRSRLLKTAEEICLHHHERYDGTGYPYGLAGTAIPVAARIVAVADVLDALVFARPYKPAWPLEEALNEISNEAGRQFDPEIVRACLMAFSPDQGGLSPLATVSSWQEVLQLIAELRERVRFETVGRSASW